jgi:hypothetical protein
MPIRGNIFDLKPLHRLKIVNDELLLVTNKHYWVVYSPKGLVITNWKTKVCVKNVYCPERTKDKLVIAECSIMDDNYTFSQVYDTKEYTFFEYE